MSFELVDWLARGRGWHAPAIHVLAACSCCYITKCRGKGGGLCMEGDGERERGGEVWVVGLFCTVQPESIGGSVGPF